MSRYKSKLLDWSLTLVFGVAVFLFWWRSYPFALSYQEQFQLFLFDQDYLLDRLAEPGGAVRYVAELLVQFYNSVVLGALVIAVLLMLMQRLTLALMQGQGARSKEQEKTPSTLHLPPSTFHPQPSTFHPLSFLLPVLVWYMMGDESQLLAFPVAIIVTQLLMLLVRWLAQKGLTVRIVSMLVLVPVGYWLCGPVVLVLAAYIGLANRPLRLTDWVLAAVGVGYGALCVYLSSFMVPYTVSQLFCGLGYYRFFEVMLLTQLLAVVLTVALPVVAAAMPQLTGPSVKGRLQAVGYGGLVVGVAVLCAVVVPMNFDAKTYELIEYDYLVRTNQWDKVIAKAEQQTPDLPMSVCATNLALAMKGELDVRLFDFYQRGTQGLLPKFERNYFTTLTTGEAYFYLGLVNTSQRFAFEAMEAIPNYNKSSRCVRRLAETNLINGHYEVARKYLQMLEKTLFYRKWAQRTMALLGNEQQINAHPLYGHLRQMQLEDDFLFSDQELDKICGQLVMKNSKNKMATQYLLMYPLLDRDINRFMNYMAFVSQQNPGYTTPLCQEAAVFAYASLQQQPPQGAVPPAMLQRFNSFMQAYRSKGSLEMYRHTVWYYFAQK
ncbi:MAG: hypothetical protein IJ527_04010 [Prevotella sp.]|nr:hypothetical protein [Prevotella sp.]